MKLCEAHLRVALAGLSSAKHELGERPDSFVVKAIETAEHWAAEALIRVEKIGS